MTLSSLLFVCAILSAFLLFGGALAWADFHSRRRPGHPAAGQQQPKDEPEPLRKAA